MKGEISNTHSAAEGSSNGIEPATQRTYSSGSMGRDETRFAVLHHLTQVFLIAALSIRFIIYERLVAIRHPFQTIPHS